MAIHFKQEKDYTCGCACARMILADFGVHVSEATLEKMLGTDPQVGTHYTKFLEVGKKFGMDVFIGEGDDGKRMKNLLNHGFKIITLITSEEPHYAILSSFGRRKVKMRDPDFDRAFKLRSHEFFRRWSVSSPGFEAIQSHRLWIAMRKKQA